ncbi:MAG TPA: hypothetical protein VNM66_05995, partial [Thermodesulfobacteriota bacterium]|nr:hypothetical protein [Thermodesulfobacteriota bacterium]
EPARARRATRTRGAVCGLLAAAALPAGPAAAHQRWFADDRGRPLDPASVGDPASLAAIGTAVAITAVVYLIWRAVGRRSVVPGFRQLGADPERHAVLLGLLPVVLALHAAVPLFVSGVQLHLFAPNLSLAGPEPIRLRSVLGAAVALAEIAIGLAFVYGAFTRVAAAVLAALWLVGVARFGLLPLLEQAIVLGIALFLFITGRGPFSVDAALSARLGPLPGLAPYAVPALRVLTGVSLAAGALGEKLWNLPFALEFLQAYPVNFLPALGLPVPDPLFVRLAGTVELTAGLLLVVGAFVREAIVVLWLPFNLTLAVFGWQELIGHLPIYGAMAVLLVWGKGEPEDVAALVRALRQRPELAPEAPADR